jgi:dephospho-CoA kinase
MSTKALSVGLTGGLGSGKTTVARWLAEAGFTVIDADQLVAELHRPGQPGAKAVAALFGPEMLDAQGGVDHAKVAAKVFADREARRALEDAIHPLVHHRFQEIAAAASGIVVLEATLLVEAGFAPSFDLVVTVECDAETRLQRAVARGMDPDTARARLLAQGSGEERREAAHRVIDNNTSLADLRHQVDELIVELERLAAGP